MTLTPNQIRLADTIALESFVKAISPDTRQNIAVWCLECLTAEQVIEVLTDSVPDTGLRQIADHINTLSLECDAWVETPEGEWIRATGPVVEGAGPA